MMAFTTDTIRDDFLAAVGPARFAREFAAEAEIDIEPEARRLTLVEVAVDDELPENAPIRGKFVRVTTVFEFEPGGWENQFAKFVITHTKFETLTDDFEVIDTFELEKRKVIA